MSEGRVSRRYAKAIFELAAGREESIAEELGLFLAALEHRDLRHVLGNPAFNVERRKEIVAELAERLKLSDLTAHFLALLLTRERLDALPAIVRRYRSLLDAARGRVNAKVFVSHPLAEEQRERLVSVVSRITGKTAVLTEEADPSLLGGIIIEVGGKVYDGSVRTRLRSLRQNIERAG